MLRRQKQRRWAARLLGVGLLGTFFLAVTLGYGVILDLEEQRSASSDNVQWTLTQVEAEYLRLMNALEHVAHSVDDVGVDRGELAELRRQFDIFYSRVDTLQTSPLFADLRNEPAFSAFLQSVEGFLNGAIPKIDAPDDVLAAESDVLMSEAMTIGQDVRNLSLSGLSHFATVSDSRRLDTANTLLNLAILTSVAFLGLVGLSYYLIAANRDINRRSAELAQANHRMNTILSTSLDAVIVVNSKGEVLEFNSAAEHIFGYSFDEVKGKPIGGFIIPPEMRDAHAEGMRRMQTGGEKHVVGKGRVQLQALRANGETFPVELALQSAFDGSEEIVIGFVRDISRRYKAEKELISARDRALAGEKAKADFLTVMSHEIRTPLNGILGNLSLLKNARPNKKQSQFIRNMEVSGKVLMRHVDSVLDIARFEAGKPNLMKEAVNLSDLMQELVDAQSGYAATRGNAIEWQWLGEQHPWVMADGQRLRQVLLNLVGNAIKFTENGRISLEIETTETDPDTGADVYEFRIIDTGVGVAADDLDKIFEDFHTHDPSLGRTSEGTGLGLGIARRIVKAFGGEIGVESEPGEGSVFWVRLPLHRAAPQDRQRPAARRTVGKADALDLLVVEDNQINLEVIRNMLESQGHRVTLRSDGKSGVDAAAVHRYDAILMDISMPVMDGLTAARYIRDGEGQSSDSPIVGVSANVLPEFADEFTKAGMNGFIRKPISFDELQNVLADVTGLQRPSGNTSPHIAEMREDLGSDAFERLLGRFIDEADHLINTMAAHSDRHALGAECHKVAGSAAVFGTLEFREALIDIENAARNPEVSDLSTRFHHAEKVWSAARKSLSEQA